MPILDIISMVTGALLGAYGLFYVVIAVFGLKKRKSDFAKTAPSKRLAALIAARNEENVIPQLIESLQKQNYPRDMYDIVVVPNNCTDSTEQTARDLGARIVNVRVPVHSKGEALKDAFAQLLDSDEYDAFCIFDADNIVHANFMQAANDALNAGVRIAQGYRDSKNPSASWAAGASSIFYWFMNRLYNHARRVIGSSAALNGTGFIIASSLLKETGFETHSLTEDLEYTAKCAIKGERIYWLDEAITYDEQPESIFDALSQRRRWFGGAWQCKKYYMRDLLKKHSIIAIDMALLFGSVYMMICGLFPLALSAVSMGMYAFQTPEYLLPFVYMSIMWLILAILGLQAFAVLVCLLEKKPLGSVWKAIVLFPLFMLLWMLANWSCILTGPPQWRQIKHKAVEKTPS